MTPRDWLLLLIGFDGAPGGLDPVRLQKAMFLFSQESPSVPMSEKYEFRPYNYGPMSREIYDDLDELVTADLVEQLPVHGQSWARYRASNRGVERCYRLMEAGMAQHPGATIHLFDTKQAVAAASFESLLEDVYERYPAYAEHSVFRRRA